MDLQAALKSVSYGTEKWNFLKVDVCIEMSANLHVGQLGELFKRYTIPVFSDPQSSPFVSCHEKILRPEI